MILQEFKDILQNVQIAKVIEVIKHPYADKLNIVILDIGKRLKCVITGASNLKPNDFVPLLLQDNIIPGYLLTHNEKIVLGKKLLRGLESDSMLLSQDELGFGLGNDGIYILKNLSEEHLGESILKVTSDDFLQELLN